MARSPDYIADAADRVMIMDLLARYAWEIDHGSPEGWASVFTEDGVFEGPHSGLWVQGRAALIEHGRHLIDSLPNVHHVMSNIVIDLDGDTARGRCELNEFMARPEAVYPNLQGWYEDDYVLTGQRWLISHRRVFLSEPASTVAGKVGEYFAPYFSGLARWIRR